RQQDILTYLSILRLQGLAPPPFRMLPQTVQADIKAIWKSYGSAIADGDAFLFQMGRPECMKEACERAAVGKRLPEDLYFHRSVEEDMPALIRLVVFAARQ